MKHKFILMGAAAAALALAGCSQTPAEDDAATTDTAMNDTAMADTANAGAMGSAASDHATQFLTDAMKGDNREIQAGNMAAEKGSSQAVKDYGRMLADEHGAHLTKVNTLAQTMNVTPEAKAMADKLRTLEGKEFDNAFISAMIDSHKKTIDMYRQEAASNDDAQVTGLAKETIPTLQKHLTKAQSLQSGS